MAFEPVTVNRLRRLRAERQLRLRLRLRLNLCQVPSEPPVQRMPALMLVPEPLKDRPRNRMASFPAADACRKFGAGMSVPYWIVVDMTSTGPELTPDPDSVKPSHRSVGLRFRRPLTEAELADIVEAAKQPGKSGGLARSIPGHLGHPARRR